MVNFGLLMAEIRWRVWGTPANFNGFSVLAALLHGTLVVGISQTLWRPSRWALAYILVYFILPQFNKCYYRIISIAAVHVEWILEMVPG